MRDVEQPMKLEISDGAGGFSAKSGVSIWKWAAAHAKWELVEDRSQPGFESGRGPTQPGRFEGQVVRWASVPVLNR